MPAPIVLDVFADIACPWCYIGRRHTERALAAGTPGRFTLHHRAFELQPGFPPEGLPMAEYAAARFGSREHARALFARVHEEGERVGIAFDFAGMPRAANTRLAHRAVVLARAQGAGDAALDALYRAYFEQAQDITDPAVIIARLTDAGLPDPGAVAAGLAGDGAAEEVDADLALGGSLGITGVPLTVAHRRYAVQGAQPAELMTRFLAQAEQADVAA